MTLDDRIVSPVVVIGASEHGRVVVDVLETQGVWRVIGFLDANVRVGHNHAGHEVIGTEQDLPALSAKHPALRCIVAIGDNHTRMQIVERVQAMGYTPEFFATAVHARATIARGATIGCGSVVMAGAVINPNVTIGNHCIINTSASIDHDNIWADYSSAAPGVVTGGNVRVGEGTAVAIRATILHGRKLGRGSVVGASATVIHDIPDFVVAYGTPARVVRQRKAGEKYF